jgi:hypothetical protein
MPPASTVRKMWWRWLALALLMAGFAIGLFWLFQLRFSQGDIYPAYSSLRSDPLGTRALLESFEQTKAVTVSRNFQQHPQLEKYSSLTLLMAGTRYQALDWLDKNEFHDLEMMVRRGGRLIICFLPEPPDFVYPDTKKPDQIQPGDTEDREKDQASDQDKKTAEKKTEKSKSLVSLYEQWGIHYSRFEVELDEDESEEDYTDEASQARLVASLPGLPSKFQWCSNLYFEDLAEDWKVLYTVEDVPVLVERTMGAGSVVLASDSYFLSNEGLWRDPQPALLAWLAGGSGEVMFDETHLGIAEERGAAYLARKHGLHGLLAGLLLLFILAIWKNATSLVPPLPDVAGQRGEVLLGRESAAGMVNLLRRSIVPSRLMALCWQEWQKASPRGRGKALDDTELKALVRSEKNPVRLYRELTHRLSRTSR